MNGIWDVTCTSCIYILQSVLRVHTLHVETRYMYIMCIHARHVHAVDSHDVFTFTFIVVYMCCHRAAARFNSEAETLRAVAAFPAFNISKPSSSNKLCH